MSLCSPALLYLIIGIISILSMIYSKTDIKTISMQGLFIAIWTWFLNFLCSKGHEGISWFLVILPFVVMALFIVAISNIIGGKMAQNKEMFDDYIDCRSSTNEDNPKCKRYCDYVKCEDPRNKYNRCCYYCKNTQNYDINCDLNDI